MGASLFAAIAALLSLWRLFEGDAVNAAAAAGVSIVFGLMANLPALASIKAFGVEATMKELDAKLVDAREILAKLEDVERRVEDAEAATKSLLVQQDFLFNQVQTAQITAQTGVAPT
ncbi:MAG: hypothetical protein EKK45_29800 [Curvibacter sp.]|nr:MAG: hypothetical protein EKK45_29800 [Curvibacter sp.]